ncbi:DNA-directed RNA polymerase beta subunit [Desulfurella amilsii]|uniref:DNA-directed RNA polymerase subunit beta n=2 Tax=Desulfurella amilsii TaxID=1562698 RepID=A0A1X4XWW1_9BACT|nr:DNA-directed RNA polymerase subunit beta [Desulfurella amilsii]OSS42030.1 DNA-directed RNA polymerase beta subunit [Desulfurella amilsii]
MVQPLCLDYRMRVNFAQTQEVLPVPDILSMAVESYERFLHKGSDFEKTLENAFKEIFPIEDVYGKIKLDYIDYYIRETKYNSTVCKLKGITYGASLILKVKLSLWDVDSNGNKIGVQDIKEQDIYVCELPLMTESGSFIINGVERVIVNQLHRSPGVIFKNLTQQKENNYYAQIIPEKGSWVEFETDNKNLLHIRIDRKKKFPATVILKALGFSDIDILSRIYNLIEINTKDGIFYAKIDKKLQGIRIKDDVIVDGKVIAQKQKKLTTKTISDLINLNVNKVAIDENELLDKFIAEKIDSNGSVVEAFSHIDSKILQELKLMGNFNLKTVFSQFDDDIIINTLKADHDLLQKRRIGLKEDIPVEDVAKIYLHKSLRPGEHSSIEEAGKFFAGLFFDPLKYDLSLEGRAKINETLNIETPKDVRVLTVDDFFGIINHIILFKNGKVSADDMDSLSNRRVHLIGELLYSEVRKGLYRMQRLIKDRLLMPKDTEDLTPYDVINTKPVASTVKDFFATGQLSQFLDQTNILSEISHKRRLSALGPGGLTRERAGFEVRDVHPSHYGRLCPIETPEGPNIGLIVSFSIYAKVNEYGFIETPYRIVENGKVTNKIIYMTAGKEKDHIIAQASVDLNPDETFAQEYVPSMKNGEFIMSPKMDVNLMDVSPRQIVSVTASLIPFLEHDDANRALMGSNMQRQAVPLIVPESPLIGTGMEKEVGTYSRHAVLANREGKVIRIESNKIYIAVQTQDGTFEIDKYDLDSFVRSNQDTCFSQKPIVKIGDYVKKNQVIADGPTMDKGELALGRNMVVAFVPWRGYNYEDGITLSRRVVEEDLFTSIHIKEFEVYARDTKLGPEEITADIPSASAELIKNLDKNGIVRIGAYVKPGDILVGKVTPKAETHYSPEERLLRAIFGEKASNVSDSSLRVPSDTEGTVIDVRIFRRKGTEKITREELIQKEDIKKINEELKNQLNLLEKLKLESYGCLLEEEPLEKDLEVADVTYKKGSKLDKCVLDTLDEKWIKELLSPKNKLKAKEIEKHYKKIAKTLKDEYAKKLKEIDKEDELPPSVIMSVKVFIATKRKLSVGDKMSGRHGNKGVVSRILPVCDMPFLEDGTAVDVVLNPLGVPSRMNLGQILETHLGWISKGLGKKIDEFMKEGKKDILRQYLKRIFLGSADEFIDSLSNETLDIYVKEWKNGVHFATPVFEGPKEKDFDYYKKILDIDTFKSTLFDGITGEKFLEPVTVGVMYVLKLHHLVDDKVHARSVGPYSLVTQQPLGGKAHFGGQRFGEMEVWALEGYGAAYTLQEMLTVKSDDVSGRSKMYEAIVKGKPVLLGGIPESFNVLVKELQSLGLDIELLKDVRRR